MSSKRRSRRSSRSYLEYDWSNFWTYKAVISPVRFLNPLENCSKAVIYKRGSIIIRFVIDDFTCLDVSYLINHFLGGSRLNALVVGVIQCYCLDSRNQCLPDSIDTFNDRKCDINFFWNIQEDDVCTVSLKINRCDDGSNTDGRNVYSVSFIIETIWHSKCLWTERMSMIL